MKIDVLYFRYPLYPAGSYFQEFLDKLSGSLDGINLIAVQYPKGPFYRPTNIRFFWVPFLSIRFVEDFFYMLSTLVKVMFVKDLHKVELVNTIGPRGLLAGWYLKKIYGIPLVCTIEMLNEKGSFLNNVYYEVVRFLMVKAPVDKFICWSNYYWENHLKTWGITKERVVNISGGINTDVYNPTVDGSEVKRKYGHHCPLIVFAKPLDFTNTESAKLLVQAVGTLNQKIGIKLLIGSGEGKKEIITLARKLGIEDNVEFMPPTPFPEIPKYIAAADLVVLPFTYAATTSRSLMEAMSMGKAIITTKVGEIPNILENGKEALLVNPTVKDISEAIELVLTDQNLATSLGKNAVALITKKYSLSIIVAETVQLFLRLRLRIIDLTKSKKI
jgi:glycosyltransferase involved in cell wall biosynthesis